MSENEEEKRRKWQERKQDKENTLTLRQAAEQIYQQCLDDVAAKFLEGFVADEHQVDAPTEMKDIMWLKENENEKEMILISIEERLLLSATSHIFDHENRLIENEEALLQHIDDVALEAGYEESMVDADASDNIYKDFAATLMEVVGSKARLLTSKKELTRNVN